MQEILVFLLVGLAASYVLFRAYRTFFAPDKNSCESCSLSGKQHQTKEHKKAP